MLNGRSAAVFFAYQGAFGFLFYTFATFSLLYHHTVVRLDPLQMVLVGTVLELAILCFEVPTGVVADVYSRRLSVVIGCLVIGVGFLIEGSFQTFSLLLLAQVVWGGGYTFISGAGEAWLADELAAEGRAEELTRVLLRGGQCHQAGSLLGIVASTVLAARGELQSPLIFAGCGFLVLGVLLRWAMPEQGFQPLPRGERQTWAVMVSTLKAGIAITRERPVLWRVLWVSLFFGMFSEAFDRLWVVHLSQGFNLPEVPGIGEIFWFSLAHGVSLILGIAVSEGLRRFNPEQGKSAIWVLCILTAILGIGVVLFAQTTHLVAALACFWTVSAMRVCLGPLTSAWLNRHVPSKVRATVLSLNGQADALGQMAGGPALGAVGRQVSVRAALTAAGAFLLPALVVYARMPSGEGELSGSE